jgi:hypothetical protein
MNRAPRILYALAAAVAMVASPAAAQQSGAQAPTSNQIVVQGERERAVDPDAPGAAFAARSRGLAAESAYFVRCAKLPDDRVRLSAIVDNGPAQPVAQHALHDFVMRNRGCFQGIPNLPPYPQTPYYGQCNSQLATGMCRNTFDRAALYEATLDKYADDFDLTREHTFDPAVRARFIARQTVRDRLSDKLDREYFDTVACFIQVSPQWGERLLRAKPASAAENRARANLISNGSACVGGATEVRADPSAFRAYAAEALYMWIVSAKGGETLVE